MRYPLGISRVVSSVALGTILLVNLPIAAGQPTGRLSYEQMEEQGIDQPDTSVPGASERRKVTLAAAAGGPCLLIPDSTTDVVAMFDPFDGHYIGDLINGAGTFSTPVCAIQGPDGNIYVSDQLADAVFVFDPAGAFLSVYADSTDGLNNIRGIDFFNGELYVTSGDDYVARFNGPHNRLPDFINDGSDPFDIHFLPDGRSLLTDIGTADSVRLYKTDGTLDTILFSVAFPEQVTDDLLTPGEFIVTEFTGDQISDFSLDTTIHQVTPLSNSGRGVYRLGNGNLLSAGSPGVQELTPGTGAVVTQIMTGSGWRYIERVDGSPWTNLGNALPGALGAPVLAGSGELSSGSLVTLGLSNAAANSTAYLIVGVQNLSAPFFGGTLVPSPNLVVPIPTGGAGSTLSLPVVYPAGVQAGVPIFVQYWIVDATGPLGLTASNAITQVTQ